MQSDSGHTTSVWMDTTEVPQFQSLTQDVRANVCVIGAGIAGMTTAYLLARAGRAVVLIDDGPIGGGETGRTTAHLTAALDDRYYNIARMHGEEGARLAAESHMSAIHRIETIASMEDIDCDFERVEGYLFLGGDSQRKDLERELEATHRAGINDTQIVDRLPFSFWDSGPALRFPASGDSSIRSSISRASRARSSATAERSTRASTPRKSRTASRHGHDERRTRHQRRQRRRLHQYSGQRLGHHPHQAGRLPDLRHRRTNSARLCSARPLLGHA